MTTDRRLASYDGHVPSRPVPAAFFRWPRRVAPYVAVSLIGFGLWAAVWAVVIDALPPHASDDLIGYTGFFLLLDLVIGVLAIAILPLRTRAPFAVALLTGAALAGSVAAVSAAAYAAAHFARTASNGRIAAVGAVWAGATVLNIPVAARIDPAGAVDAALAAALALILYAAVIATGRYRQARADTVELLRDRARSAEHNRERDVALARESERLRIAREMHDVLAHRISLVAMHAGALSYRDDLARDQVAEAARTISDSAGAALGELREILGVLRSESLEIDRGPQPSLADLPALIDETRAARMRVDVTLEGLRCADLEHAGAAPSASSRTAYRVVQEALTNARRYSSDNRVAVRVVRAGDRLVIDVRNAAPPPGAGSSGFGLVGLRERVDLAGGALDYGRDPDGHFFVLAWVPWT